MAEERSTRVSYVNPRSLGAPVGAYSHLGIASNAKLVSIAGQVGVDSEGRLIGGGDCGLQTEQVFANLRTALGEADLMPDSILQMITYLVNDEDISSFFAARERVFADLFPDGSYPPNTLLVVRRLVQPQYLIEVQALACVASPS